jgi:DNA-binding transcriptional MocR family regulator
MGAVLTDKPSHLYADVADKVAHLIDSGTLRPGQRVPSVRKLSAQLKVSISTVVQAYRLLEDRGRIEARPQSGYYVRARFWQRAVEPAMTRPAMRSTAVNVGEMAARVLAEGHARDVVPLGAALHAPEIFPIRQLNKLSAAIGRRSPRVGGSYDVPAGCEALRVQIARRALDAGCAIAPDDVITTGGAQEAVGFCLRAVTKPGDTIAIESPTFYGLLQLLEVMGLKALEVPTDPRTGVCLDALEKALDRTRVAACLFVNNFNNPLGSCVPDEAKRRLVGMLAGRGVPLIEDDIYGDLGFGPQRPKSAKAFDDSGGVLVCSSFSKTLAPGYRVGWCVPGRWRAEVERIKLFTNIATASVPQMAIAEFLANGGYDHHLRRVRKAFEQQIARMADAVCEHFPAGTKMTRPAGGFVLWVEMDERVDGMRLHDAALAERVAIAPGAIFSASGKYRNCIRLNCEAPWSERVEGAVRTLGRLAGEQLG